MRRRAAAIVCFLVLLIPSAQFAWRNRDMSNFGWYHDDTVYFTCAKSLAQGSGYRILSLPDQPYQTKYPPLYPLLLSLVWRIAPAFPENLKLATLLGWLMVPVFLLLAWKLYRSFGFPAPRAWALTALLAVNPYLVLFGASVLSELFFSCLLLACLLLWRRAEQPNGAWPWALAAGVTGGLAYLARSAGLMLLAPAVLLLLWRRRWLKAAMFAAPAAAAFLGWMVWARIHQSVSSDIVTVYYTDYLRYQVMNVAWADLPLFIWKNLDGLLRGIGALVLPDVTDSFLVKTLTQTIAVGMIAGTVRLARRPEAALYGWFSLFYCVVLVIWHFPPNERFVLPMLPLLLAGLLTGSDRFRAAVRSGLRHAEVSQRVTAGVLGAIAAGVFGGALLMQFYVAGVFIPGDVPENRERRAGDQRIYAWISANLPENARILAYNDPLMYLYTGRRSCSLTVAPVHWYRQDHQKVREAHRSLAEFALAHGLDYAYIADLDFRRDMAEEDAREIRRIVKDSPGLVAIHRSPGRTVYRCRLD